MKRNGFAWTMKSVLSREKPVIKSVLQSIVEADKVSVTADKPSLLLVWRKGWKWLRLCPGLVSVTVFISLIGSVLALISPLVLANIISGINASTSSAPAIERSVNTESISPDSTDTHEVKSECQMQTSSRHNRLWLVWNYAIWLSCAVFGLGLGFAGHYCEESLDLKMSSAIREELFARIIRQDPAFFHINEAGRLTLIINQMSIEAQRAFRQALLDPVFQSISFLLGLGGLIYSFAQLQQGGSSPLLWGGIAVVMLLSMLSPLTAKGMGNRLQSKTERVMHLNMDAATLVTSALKSPEEVQAFNAEDFFTQKYKKQLDHIRKANIQQAMTIETINTFNSLPLFLAQLLFLGMAIIILLVQQGPVVQAGYLIAILMIVPHVMGPIQSVASYMVMLRASWPSVYTVLSYLEQPMVERNVSSNGAEEGNSTLEAQNVVFRYRPDLPPVFNGLSFSVQPGRITGLVAKMGEGKTSFFRLALGFYQTESGRILLGGRAVDEFSLAHLRQCAVMMSQFPAFFHDTLRENLLMAKPDASDDEIREACQLTGIWRILSEKMDNNGGGCNIPDPLDRPFGGGQSLSGGQKKLLALTRCLLRSPTFLFLDEPTTGMDNIEKFGLVDNLRQACAGKTVIAVDHDIPWLLRFCDNFIVVEGGQVTQQGTGHELLARNGLFKDLFEKTHSSHVSSSDA